MILHAIDLPVTIQIAPVLTFRLSSPVGSSNAELGWRVSAKLSNRRWMKTQWQVKGTKLSPKKTRTFAGSWPARVDSPMYPNLTYVRSGLEYK